MSTLNYKKFRAILYLIFISAVLCQFTSAEELKVNSMKELEKAVSKAKPGDVIELKNGAYSEKLTLTGKGTEKNPIIICAESVGGVEISNKVTIKGEYLSLIGFRFSGKGAIQIQKSKGCRVSRCQMNNVNAAKWLVVDLKSRSFELDHNLFENKENNRKLPRGCQMVQFILTNTNERHHIHHNHFKDIPKGKNGNGFETLQLITNRNPKDPKGDKTGNVIEYNLFERCDGEAEIISVKSNGNTLRGNTFIDCRGALVLRQGHRNVVDGNWFIGGKGGVRIQGRDQVVVNNYFDSLSSGLVMMNGIGKGKQVMYVRVENALIANNTFINCKTSFRIGMNHSAFPPGVVPGKSIIANNIFYQKSSKEDIITMLDGKEPEDWTWQNNIFQGVLGIPERDGIKITEAHLKVNKEGIALPTVKTPIAGKVKTKLYSVETDLLGTKRKEQTTLGAIQYPITMPLSKITEKQVGPNSEMISKE